MEARAETGGSSSGSASGGASTAGLPPRPSDLQAPVLEGLGAHHHEISSDDPWAQRFFDQGWMLHVGFNHAEAVRSFREAARLDPQCAICFAGVALSLGPNINAPMEEDAVEPAYEAIQNAMRIREHASERERRYIEALAERYAGDPPEDRTPLDRAYAEAMGKVAEAFPADADAASLHAEALMILHAWNYWKDDGSPQPWTPSILDVLESTLERAPQHPFANHLYIHAVEASPQPQRALPSAKRLRSMAPGLGHLVHMPAHVYIRSGHYHQASLANERAVAADERYLEQVETQGLYPLAYYPHNYHFLWATTTLEGRAQASLQAARAVSKRADRDKMRKPGFGTLQHYYSIPYYALVAFGRWQAILEESAPQLDLLYPKTAWRYARGMAFVHTGQLEKAEAKLAAVRKAADSKTLEEVTIWDINSTGNLVEIAAAILEADLARARGDQEGAIETLRHAVELEDGLNYDEPPPWGPATRRYLGAALLEADRAEAAEAVYREDLSRFPRNGWSLYGLMESLRAQGESREAAKVQERFEEAWKHADVVLTSSRF